jgi:hypothetical protein
VWGVSLGPRRLRLMTHLDVDDDQVVRAAKALLDAPA